MLYPTELRAHTCFQLLMRRVLSNIFAQCSRPVLQEVSVNLLGSVSQVSLLDGIVPFPHLLGLMANNFHNCRCIHPCASEMSRSTVAHAMKPEVRDTSLLEGRIERPAAAAQWSFLIQEAVSGCQALPFPTEPMEGLTFPERSRKNDPPFGICPSTE